MDDDTRRKLIEFKDYLVREVDDWKRCADRESMLGSIDADGKAGVLEKAKDRLYELFPKIRD